MADFESTNDYGGSHDLPFPTGSATPDVPRDFKNLAQKVDDELAGKSNDSHDHGTDYLTRGGTANVKLDNNTTTAKNWVPSAGGTFTGSVTLANFASSGDYECRSKWGLRFTNNNNVPSGTAGNAIKFRWGNNNIYGTVDGVQHVIVGTASDRRTKTNISEAEGASSIEYLNDLNVVEYNPVDVLAEGYSEQTKNSFVLDEVKLGLIADEVPNNIRVTSEDPDAYESVNYLGVVPYLISAVQELTKRNEALEQRIAELEANNE